MRKQSVIATAIIMLLPFLGHPARPAGFLDRAKSLLENNGITEVPSDSLSDTEIGDGLREALRVGTQRVVAALGRTDGFNGDPQIHIPLPDNMQRAQKFLRRFGLSAMADDLELRLNRAAEAAIPEASSLFADTIAAMTIDDVRAIYNGPKDAATQYFRKKMQAPLAERMKPIVEKALGEAGAIKSYDALIGEYKSIPLVPDIRADLTRHVVTKALDGAFLYLAREEAKIRENPAARSTALLKKVFGGN